jgi:AP2-like factor (ANT lineage)
MAFGKSEVEMESDNEIAALDKHLAVSGGEERKSGGGASAGASGGMKVVPEAMRKYAALRSSRFHGVTRCGQVAMGNRVPLVVLWID